MKGIKYLVFIIIDLLSGLLPRVVVRGVCIVSMKLRDYFMGSQAGFPPIHITVPGCGIWHGRSGNLQCSDIILQCFLSGKFSFGIIWTTLCLYVFILRRKPVMEINKIVHQIQGYLESGPHVALDCFHIMWPFLPDKHFIMHRFSKDYSNISNNFLRPSLNNALVL